MAWAVSAECMQESIVIGPIVLEDMIYTYRAWVSRVALKSPLSLAPDAAASSYRGW